MKKTLFALSLVSSLCLGAQEYFVGVNGSDKNPGTSEAAPLRTIKKAVTGMKAGDTVTILPGEYLEEATLTFKGVKGKPTTIRAKIPGSVHMRGDVPAPAFTAVPGRKNVWVCSVKTMPQYVLERDTLKKYQKMPSVNEVEYTPGSSFFDEEGKKVYIQCTDRQSPAKHLVTFSLLRGDALRFTGTGNYDLHIEGIIFSGYNSATRKVNASSTFGGIYILQPESCSIRNCIIYLSGGGITTTRGGNTVIEDCVLFCNENEFNGSGGNLICFGPVKQSVQRRIISFGSGMAGQRFYGGTFDHCLIDSCVAFDNQYGDVWIKYPSATSKVIRTYASNAIHSRYIENCVFSSGDTYYDGKAQLSICRSREKPFSHDREFVDPAHLDFHLQKNSRFRNREGGDWGSAGFSDKIFFVSPKGNDGKSGNSTAEALKTLGAASAKLSSGGRLYLTGRFDAPLVLKGLSDVIIRGRGVTPAVLAGGVTLVNCKNVLLENLNVTGAVSFGNTPNLTLKRCLFTQEAAIPAGASVRHCLFAKKVSGAAGGFLRGNIFVSSFSGKPRFSGWNAYVTGNIPAGETGSFKAPAPEFSAPAAGDYTLRNHYAFAGRCGDGFPAGPYRYDSVVPAGTHEVRVGAVSATTATVIVRSPWISRSNITVRSGKEKARVARDGGQPEYAISFTGLVPGSAFKGTVEVTPYTVKRITNAPFVKAIPVKLPVEFTTLKEDRPRTLHVAQAGDNRNDGSSPEKAFGSICAAVEKARPGDTVLVGPGVYKETVRVFATGDTGKRLTIAGKPGSEVIIDGFRKLPQGFFVRNKNDIRIDNFHIMNNFGNCSLGTAGGVVLHGGKNITLSRIFYDNRIGNGQRAFSAGQVRNLLIENCVGVAAFGGISLSNCPNLEVRNCVFVRNKVNHGYIGTTPEAGAVIHHCIFAGHELQKVQNPCLGVGDAATFKEHDNGFLVRVSRAQKPVYSFYKRNGGPLPKNDGGEILNTEWMRQGRFGQQILSYDAACKFLGIAPTALFGDPKMKALPWFYHFKDLTDWHNNYIKGQASPGQKELFKRSNNEELQRGKTVVITDYLATNPEFLKRGIGLDPAAFKH